MASVSRYLRQNVLGLVAIFLALSGGAYAAVTTNSDLATGAVDSRVLAAGAVEGPDIHSASVGPKKMKLDKLEKWLQTRVSGSCGQGETVQGIMADGSVICAPDQTGSGDITGVTTSGGLTGGASSGDVALGVDSSVIQSRVGGTCTGVNSIQSVAANGTVACSSIPSDAAVGTASLRSLGTGANQAAAGDDPRLSDNRTPTDGSVSAAKFAGLPHGKIRQTGTCQSIADNGTFQQIAFNNLQFGSGVSFSDANDTLTVNTAGTYQVSAYANWTQNGTGSRGLELLAGGGVVELAYDGREGSSVVNTGQTASGLVKLSAGDTLFATAGQNSGGALAFTDPFGSQGCANIAVQWIGP
jgi:hypothetical protein